MATTFTSKGQATRARIVIGAAALIREQGVAETTLEDICRRTSTSKSQLFHYFPDGKEQLLLAVAQVEADRVLSDQQPHLGRLNSWRAWRSWRDAVVDRYRRQGRECPLGGLVTQLGRSTPGTQAVVTELLRQWQVEIAAGIREMQRLGKIGQKVDANRSSAALLAGIQGGVLVMLSTGSLMHLEAVLDTTIESLRASI